MGPSVRLIRLFGIPIEVNFSWVFIFLLVVVMLGVQFGDYPEWSAVHRWALAVGIALLFFMSVVAHELSPQPAGVEPGDTRDPDYPVPLWRGVATVPRGAAAFHRVRRHRGGAGEQPGAGPGAVRVVVRFQRRERHRGGRPAAADEREPDAGGVQPAARLSPGRRGGCCGRRPGA